MRSRLLSVVVLLALLLAAVGSGGVSADPGNNQGGLERVIVHFQPGAKGAVVRALQAAGAQLHYEFDELNAVAVSLPTAARNGIERNPNVVLVEEDVVRYAMQTGGDTIPYGIDMVQARDVWDADRDFVVDAGAPTGAGITVCVIDAGYSSSHVEFQGVTVLGGYPSTYSTDTCGHGTHVAGTIAAALNNQGVVGVTPGGVSFYFVQVFSGAACDWTYSSTLADAANRCKAAGADVISMSLGGSQKSKLEQNTFDSLYAAGILSIAAAGNAGTSALSYPASYSSVVSVAAIDSSMAWADFSQYNSQVELAAPGVAVLSTVPWISTNTLTVGGNTYSGGHIEYAAYTNGISGQLVNGELCGATNAAWAGKVVLCQRGEFDFVTKVASVQNSGGVAAVIYNNVPGDFLGTLGEGNSSTIPAISLSQAAGVAALGYLGQTATVVATAPVTGNGYEAWDGTSMATPHVSGVAALVWSSKPTATNVEIRNALTSTAFDLGTAGRDVYYGYGLVQAKAAVDSLGGGGTTNEPPVAAFTTSISTRTVTFNASGSTDDGGIVSYAWAFGDGSYGSGMTVVHTYAAKGTYTVVLTVTDNGTPALTDTATASVRIRK